MSGQTLSINPEADKLIEYAAFDVLRFILASSVMLSHMEILTWSQSGNLAVQVFFALSGWLIGRILCNTSGPELSRFYFNRVTRIWIPYFFTVTALYLASLLHEPLRSPRWSEFLVYDVTFTHNWFTLRPDAQLALSQMPLMGTGNHFWSLAVEEQFYLVAPLIITLIPFGRNIILWLGIAALTCLNQSEYASISFGVLAAVIAQKYPDWHRNVLGNIALLIAAVGTSIGLWAINDYTFVAPVFAISIVLLCAKPISRNSFTRWLGGISFPFYLNAWIGVFVVHGIEGHLQIAPSWYSVPVTYLAGLAAGASCYLLIDSKVMAARQRYYSKTLGWTLGAIAYSLVIGGVIFWVVVRRDHLPA